jgi:YidC/Oxa1 family membrane protein insertase
MEKRLILAIALSFLVILLWAGMQSKPLVPPPQPVRTPTLVVEKQKTDPSLEGAPLLFSLDIYKLNFWENQAALREVVFSTNSHDNLFLFNGFALGDKSWEFKKAKASAESIAFLYQNGQKKIIKDFIFHKSSYSIELELEIVNLSNAPQSFDLPILLGTLNFSRDPAQSQYLDVVVGRVEKTLHLNGRSKMSFADCQFLALRNRYFCAIIQPTLHKYSAFIEKISPQESAVGLLLQPLSLSPGEVWKEKLHIYLGPQDLKQIGLSNPAWTNVIHYGYFDIISQVLLSFLAVLQRLVHSLGLAIILLSALIYFLLFPLTLKQMRSMKEMQQLQPRIEALKKTYKDNPAKLNKEVMGLYREHKVNPLGGCLPVVLQIPIFFALYQALVRTITLKGAKFLWIQDLSQPDRLATLPVTLPFVGNAFNLLPILMAIAMFVQQKNTAVSSVGTSAEQQKLMLILFPIIFGLIFYTMPSGLVLYWFTNSLLTLFYQLRMNKAKV